MQRGYHGRPVLVSMAIDLFATTVSLARNMTKEANMMMNVGSTLERVLAELATVARAEGVELPAGPPEKVAHAYLVDKVPHVFNVMVPARSVMLVTIPVPEPSTQRGIALANVVGLLVGYCRCDGQVAARHAALLAAEKAAEPLRQLVAAVGSAVLSEFRKIGEDSAALSGRLDALLAGVEPALSTKALAARQEALVYNVVRELAKAFEVNKIVELVDDGQRGDTRKRRARFVARLEALKQWPSSYSEGFLLGSFGPAVEPDTDSAAKSS